MMEESLRTSEIFKKFSDCVCVVRNRFPAGQAPSSQPGGSGSAPAAGGAQPPADSLYEEGEDDLYN